MVATQIFLECSPLTLGKISNLTITFQMGWNRQPEEFGKCFPRKQKGKWCNLTKILIQRGWNHHLEFATLSWTRTTGQCFLNRCLVLVHFDFWGVSWGEPNSKMETSWAKYSNVFLRSCGKFLPEIGTKTWRKFGAHWRFTIVICQLLPHWQAGPLLRGSSKFVSG